MLIQSGRVSSLSALPWVALELTSESRTDEIVLHLIRWAVSNLEAKSIPFQLLYPVASRSGGKVELLSPYLWMRTPSPASDLRGITRIMGMQGMMAIPGGHWLSATDDFIRTIIAKSQSAQAAWSNGISCGSGVRVLVGHLHSLCGIVEHLYPDGDAEVRIALRSRAVRLRIPVRALQHLGHTPEDYFEKEDD